VANAWRFLPGLADLRGYDRRRQLKPDLMAGVTVAAVAVPAGLAWVSRPGCPGRHEVDHEGGGPQRLGRVPRPYRVLRTSGSMGMPDAHQYANAFRLEPSGEATEMLAGQLRDGRCRSSRSRNTSRSVPPAPT